MVKIDIIAGFLGAGKTTWINKMLSEAYAAETIVIIENEFGEIGIDGELLSGYNAVIKEITSGCICCTLYGDFVVALRQIIADLHPSRILIEPTGIGRSNDVIAACNKITDAGRAQINTVITIVDATMLPVFIEMGGELYFDQINTAHTLLVSHCDDCESPEELHAVLEELATINPNAHIIATPWTELSALEALTIAEEQTLQKLDLCNEQHGHYVHQHNHKQNQQHVNEGFSVISFRPTKCLSKCALSEFFSSISEGRFGEVFRAKFLLTLNDGHRIKGDYVYGKWQQTPYPGKGEDRFVMIGKDLYMPVHDFTLND